MIVRLLKLMKSLLLSFKTTGKKNITFTVINSILISFGLSILFEDFYVLRTSVVTLFITTIVINSLLMLIHKNLKNLLCYLSILGFVILCLLISRLFKINYMEEALKVYNWFIEYDGTSTNYNKNFGFVSMLMIQLISIVIIYLFHCIKWCKSVVAASLPILLVICGFNEIHIPKITIGVILFYSLTELARLCGKRYFKSNSNVDNNIAILYLAPACFIIALSAILLPSHTEPIEWKGIKNFIYRIEERGSLFFTQLELFFDRTGSEFSVAFTGYSEELDKLGHSITESKKTSLIISTTNKSTATGYLMGSISDIYTGISWDKSKEERKLSHEEYYYDFYELLNALSLEEEGGNDVRGIVKNRYFNIKYNDIKTRSLFYPLKTYNMNFKGKEQPKETNQGAFLYKKAKSYGLEYRTGYGEVNLNSEHFLEMLRNGGYTDHAADKLTMITVARNLFGVSISNTDFDMDTLKHDLELRRELIKKNYMALPESLPDRVRDLALEITKEYKSDYDKLKAIEKYLSTYKYTTNVEELPKGEDFIDYFLFERKQGYCTYFATAMGVLARCAGIPTRYVEGFVVNYKNQGPRFDINVLSNNAHSWIDAYIEGIGWIPFEPTPPFLKGRYNFWEDRLLRDDENEQNDSLGEDESFVLPGTKTTSSDDVKSTEPRPQVKENNKYTMEIIGIVLSILLILIMISLSYYGILLLKYKKKYDRASSEKRLIMKFTEIIHYLKNAGFPLSSEDTLISYLEQIGNRLDMNNISFKDVALIYMKVRYGEYMVTDDELKTVYLYCEGLQNYLNEKLGKAKMFFERFYIYISLND